jgi:hypothetical protein
MIPTQRSGQVPRLLVLGTGDEARALRDLAVRSGAELAQRFSSRVTHVVADDTVAEEDARVVRARAAGLPVLGPAEGIELIEGLVADAPASQLETPEGGEPADYPADGAIAAVDTGAALDAPIVTEFEGGGAADAVCGSTLEVALVFPPLTAGGPLADGAADGRGLEAGDDGFSAAADEPSIPDIQEDSSGTARASAEPAAAEPAAAESALLGATAVVVAAAWPPQDTASQSTDGPTSRGGASLPSVAWALVPLVSFGLLTPVAIGYAAFRLRSRALLVATAWYAFAVCAALAASVAAPKGTDVRTAVSYAYPAIPWLGGTLQSFLLRRRVFR